ncbi:hypothetical protein PUN28_006750 [Cardiocondyla obscurior]|uniref:Uncharacterized protein n=1 Tax=Cardiocondyla obscurior TaxID=286306 RepID=A0AAW2FZS2_9HYME
MHNFHYYKKINNSSIKSNEQHESNACESRRNQITLMKAITAQSLQSHVINSSKRCGTCTKLLKIIFKNKQIKSAQRIYSNKITSYFNSSEMRLQNQLCTVLCRIFPSSEMIRL